MILARNLSSPGAQSPDGALEGSAPIGARETALRLNSSYVTRDGRPVHRNFGLVTERYLNVRTSTLRVGHLAR